MPASKTQVLSALLGLALAVAPAAAQTPAAAQMPDAPAPASMAAPDAPGADDRPLEFQKGKVKLGALAEANLSAGYLYLADADARFVTEKIWGNPADPTVVGLILPVSAQDPAVPDGDWGVVVAYNDDGHVDDDDAADLDAAAILEEMQAAMPAANEERRRLGYDTLELLGWAQPPFYDATTRRIHWAKRLKAASAPENTINYDIRVLGRAGYLELVAVGAESDLPRMEAGMRELLTQVQFVDGHRYEQYDSAMDKAAAYGVGALVAGKLAAKIGLLAKLGGFVLVFKKVIILAVAGIGVGLARLLRRKKAGDA